MFPIVEEIKSIAPRYKRIIVMEMNAGQYVHEIERVLRREVEFVSVIGGRMDLQEIKEKIYG